MAEIKVQQVSTDPNIDPLQFETTVMNGENSQTTHKVTVSQETYQRLTGGLKSAEELVHASFEFLLDREPKESILPEFNLIDIKKYFPEYETVISSQLAR